MKSLPIFDISGFGNISDKDILVKPFAPYLKEHHKLLVPHGHTFYHIVFFTTGSGSHTIDFDSFEVKPYQIYFMIPGQVHHWNFKGKVDGYVLNFTDTFFQSFLLQSDYLSRFSFFQGVAKEAVIEIPLYKQSKVMALFEEMIPLNIKINPLHLDKLRVLILQLFLHIADVQQPFPILKSSPYSLAMLKNFKKLIEKHYAKLKLPREYAPLLAITPNHLNAICHDLLGKSAGELIRNRIILEAKRLLVNHDLPIANIAYRLNFNDNSYFSKFFKRHVGITPEAFRKQIGK